jgi:hypothetical protein
VWELVDTSTASHGSQRRLEMPEAHWTPWMVEERFVEAADVMAAQ